MSVVVRCPACRGMSRVEPAAVGELVLCPRCHGPFVAAAEAEPVPDRAEPPPPRRPARRPRRPRHRAEPVAPPPGEAAAAHPDPHDQPHAGGLPASVLIGLALLPFVIPLLWLIAPLALGQPPALSMAAPTALAVAASALSLAVIYTIDWTPATRVKGVLMLVGLAYFAGVSLYFLKKDMLDRVKRAFDPGIEMKEFGPPNHEYKVKMPRKVVKSEEQPLGGWKLECHRATQPGVVPLVYVVGAGADRLAGRPDDVFFEAAKEAVRAAGGGQAVKERDAPHDGLPGRQWEVQLGGGESDRIVRVLRARGRVYYLAVEGPNLHPEDGAVADFFDSFAVQPKD